MHHSYILLTLVVASRSICSAGQLVADEALRLRVLQLAFPDARISTLPSQPDAPRFPVTDPGGRVIARLKDVLVGGPDYEVTAPVAREEENAASDVVSAAVVSDRRHLQMRLYRWNSTEPSLAAVLRYTFTGANPSRCCLAIGKVLLLPPAADRIWDVFRTAPHAFTEYTGVEFLPPQGAIREKLMISCNASGVGSSPIISIILDASNRRMKPLLAVDTVELNEADLEEADVHTLSLDLRRTLASGESRFFFTKKSYVDKGKFLRTPVATTVSFRLGYGLPLDGN